MPTEPRAPIPKHRRRGLEVPLATAVVVAALALALPLAPGAAASYGGGEPVAWTNGLVLCQFSGTVPEVSVSALNLTGTGMLLSTMSVGEASPNGSMVSTAELADAVWNVSNDSSDDAYVLVYAVHVTLESTTLSAASDRWTPAALGSADLEVTFVLPAYAGSPDGPTDVVNFSLTVANWTWQSPADHLVVGFAASPSFPLTETLTAAVAPGWLLVSSSVASGAELERMGMSPTASVVSSGGASAVLPDYATMQLSPAVANVTIVLSSLAGAASSATFTGRVGIVLPTTVAGIPTSEFVAAVAAATLVSALVAVGAQRVRRRRSRLIYVDEEEIR